MTSLLLRCCFLLCLISGVTAGYAQSKPARRSSAEEKPPPTRDSVVRIGALPETEQTEEQPDIALPEMPEIDTTAAPDDELTREIEKLMDALGSIDLATVVMKDMINLQRKSNQQIPAKFFDRFLEQIESGRVSRLLNNMVIKIYRNKFTLVEIQELNKFYATPVGKKVARELTLIYDASRADGENLGRFIAMEIVYEMMKNGEWK